MNLPEPRRYGDTWEYLWADQGYAIGFSSLRETRGEVHGEIWVGTDEPTDNRSGHVLWGSFNLSSPTTRARTATQLLARTKHGKLDTWISMLEYACLVTQEEFRKGDPLQQLTGGPVTLKVEYLVSPLLILGETTCLVGDGNTCKGWLAHALCLSVRLGGSVIPGLKPTKQVNTLYLDWETSYQENQRRIELLCRGLGIETRPSGMYYRRMARSLADDVIRVREMVDRHQIGLVIADSAAPATGGDMNESDPATRLMDALRGLAPATRALIGHITKEAARQHRGRARMYGNVFFENLSRSIWEVKADTETDPIEIGLIHTKVNMGRQHKPLGLTLQFDDENHKATFGAMRVTDSPKVSQYAPISVRMAAALQRGSLYTSELAEELGVSQGDVRTVGRRELSKGTLVQLSTRAGKGGRGKEALWGLAATREEGTTQIPLQKP